jgi:hypothetical protein
MRPAEGNALRAIRFNEVVAAGLRRASSGRRNHQTRQMSSAWLASSNPETRIILILQLHRFAPRLVLLHRQTAEADRPSVILSCKSVSTSPL